MTFDIITVGSALLDIYLKSDGFTSIPHHQYPDGIGMCLEQGGKTEVGEVEVCSGGGGSNNAVSFARKGFKTALIAEVGTDLVAATIKEELKREHVDLGLLVEEHDESTGISSILVSPTGCRSIAVFRGASGLLTEDDIHWNRLDAKWLYISSLGGEMNLLSELINVAKLNGIKVAVNPGKKELKQAKAWGGLSLYQDVDVLLVNREEAGLLTGQPFDNDAFWRSDKATIEGPLVTLITDGQAGGKIINGSQTTLYHALKIRTVEETGAGDAFGSGFVAALMKGRDVTTAVEWAKRQAASVVSYMGAKRGLLTLTQIQQDHQLVSAKVGG